MSKYSPELLEFQVSDYNLNEINLSAIKQDGIHLGRSLMKDEILNIIRASSPTSTKAVAKIIELIEKIKVDNYVR